MRKLLCTPKNQPLYGLLPPRLGIEGSRDASERHHDDHHQHERRETSRGESFEAKKPELSRSL